jgi:hypothetical protein
MAPAFDALLNLSDCIVIKTNHFLRISDNFSAFLLFYYILAEDLAENDRNLTLSCPGNACLGKQLLTTLDLIPV